MIRCGWRVAQVKKGSVYHLAGVDGVPHKVVYIGDLELGAVFAELADLLLSEHTEAYRRFRVKNQDAPRLPLKVDLPWRDLGPLNLKIASEVVHLFKIADREGNLPGFLKRTPDRAQHHDLLPVMVKMTALIAVDIKHLGHRSRPPLSTS